MKKTSAYVDELKNSVGEDVSTWSSVTDGTICLINFLCLDSAHAARATYTLIETHHKKEMDRSIYFD